MNGDIVLNTLCLSIKENSFTLFDVPISTYRVLLFTRLISNSRIEFRENSSAEIKLSIISLQDSFPSITLSSPYLDFGISDRNDLTDVEVRFGIKLPGADSQEIKSALNICISVFKIEKSEESDIHQLLQCVEAGSVLTISNVPVGLYKYELHLTTSTDTGSFRFESSLVSGSIDIRLFSEFQPSYEWQLIRAWETIPSGLETR